MFQGWRRSLQNSVGQFDSDGPCYKQMEEDFIISTEHDGQTRRMYALVCPICNKKIYLPKHVLRDRVACSRSCSDIVRQRTIKKTCAHCGNEFFRRSAHLQNSKSGMFFCNRKCKEDSQSYGGKLDQIIPNRRGGKYTYRKRALGNLGKECAKCGYGKDQRMLDVDHIDSDRDNAHISNLQVLCVWCHALKTRKVTE